MLESRTVNWGRLGGLALALVLAGNLIAQPFRALRDLQETDFAVFASASRILASGSHCLYCLSTQRAFASAYLSATLPITWNPFVNPPLAAWILQPLAGLPPTAALAIFVSVALGCVIASALLIYRRLLNRISHPKAVVLTVAAVASLPGAWGIAIGQWTSIILLPLTVAVIWLHQRERSFATGMLLATALVKPQLVLLVPVAVLATRQWRVLAGFSAGACVWIATSFLILGASASDWLTFVGRVQDVVAVQMLGIPGGFAWLTGRPGAALIGFMVLVPVAIVGTLYLGRRLRNPAGIVALAVVGSLLLSPHINGDDFILCAPALALWGRRQPLAALIAALSLSLAFLLDVAVEAPSGAHVETLVVAGILIGTTRALMRVPGRPLSQTPVPLSYKSVALNPRPN